MYDDLLGPKPEPKKELKNKINLVDDNAKPANPDKYPSHESARNHSTSSCSDSDCEACDDEGCPPKPLKNPTPKDPWADVTNDDDEDDDDLMDLNWDEDDCHGDCENCDDELCKGVEDMLGDFFEPDDEDAEDTWAK